MGETRLSFRCVFAAVATGAMLPCGVAAPVGAAVITISSSKDNTLYHDESGALSNGAGEFFFVGNTFNGVLRRGLVMFDLESIPPGLTINNASLTLHMA